MIDGYRKSRARGEGGTLTPMLLHCLPPHRPSVESKLQISIGSFFLRAADQASHIIASLSRIWSPCRLIQTYTTLGFHSSCQLEILWLCALTWSFLSNSVGTLGLDFCWFFATFAPFGLVSTERVFEPTLVLEYGISLWSCSLITFNPLECILLPVSIFVGDLTRTQWYSILGFKYWPNFH